MTEDHSEFTGKTVEQVEWEDDSHLWISFTDGTLGLVEVTAYPQEHYLSFGLVNPSMREERRAHDERVRAANYAREDRTRRALELLAAVEANDD